MDAPKIEEKQWIKVGVNEIDAYVFNVDSPDRIRAGYMQNGTKAIKEEFIWNDKRWEFKNDGPSGVYLKAQDTRIVEKGPRQ